MVGGLGNDTYIVDNAGDVVTEGLNGGTDLIKSSVSWVLDENVEKLTLTGASDIDGTGNALANTLTGNSGANVLDGGNGVDVLAGGLGNDTYLVDILKTSKGLLALQDTVTEAANAGADTLKLRASSGLGFATTQTYTLAANLENLDATQVDDSNAINLTGNTLANTIIGNDADNIINGGAGNDTLIGGLGDDVLTGGSGADVSVFLGSLGSIDHVTDFNLAQGDKIDIKDLLVGYDPLTKAITDFVEFTTSGSSTIVKVDVDGTETGSTWQQIAILDNVTGLTDEAALKASGNLVV
jgi:serralysin